eukprot:gene5906-5804_t
MNPTAAAPDVPLRGVVCDLDGTLLGPDVPHTIPEANVRALVALDAAGVSVSFASGRHLICMQPYLDTMSAAGVKHTAVVSCNGSLVTIADSVVHNDGVPAEMATRVLD